MEVWDIFRDCKSGIDFENTVVKFLRCLAFEANRTGKDDGGIDIVATTSILSTKYTFYIQCKYFNTPLGKHPIQEVYAGTNYYGGNGKPVVITNNKVTVDARVYSGFAESEHIQLEQIEADKHSKGAYNLGRINALHSSLSAYYPKSAERAPATKYLDLSLMLFWWLEKNGQLSSADKVDKLYELISDEIIISGTDYKSITSRELTLNTKGLFPNKV